MLNKLTASAEDYLETIFIINKTHPVVRVKDISTKLKVSMPSVNTAVKNLSKTGHVEFEKYGYIQLTKKGVKEATRIYKIHLGIKKFFVDILKIDPAVAEDDACKLEHHISAITVQRIDAFMDFIEQCKKMDCPAEFEKYYKQTLKS